MQQENGENKGRVALRAYEIYLDRGGQHGRDIDDWLQAEQEVLAEADEQKKLYARKQPEVAQSSSTGSPRKARRSAQLP